MAGRLTKEEEKENLKNNALGLGGGLGIAGGSRLVKDVHGKGHLTGVRKFYHNAPSEAMDAIKQEGLKKSKAVDPNNLTNQVLSKQIKKGYINPDDIKDKVYLAKNKRTADAVGNARAFKSFGAPQKTFGVNIPIEDLKKMTSYENPELMGAKSSDEWLKKLKKVHSNTPGFEGLDTKNPIVRKFMKVQYKDLGKGTKVLGNDISAKYIKDSPHYQKQNLKGFANYVKKNPGRFAKGVGLTGIGAAGVAGGAYALGKGVQGSKNLKKKVLNRESEERKARLEARKQRLEEQRMKSAFEIVEEEFYKIANDLSGSKLRERMRDDQPEFIEFVQNNRDKLLPTGGEVLGAFGKGVLLSTGAGAAANLGARALKLSPTTRGLATGIAAGSPMGIPLGSMARKKSNALLEDRFGENASKLKPFNNNLQKAYSKSKYREEN